MTIVSGSCLIEVYMCVHANALMGNYQGLYPTAVFSVQFHGGERERVVLCSLEGSLKVIG